MIDEEVIVEVKLCKHDDSAQASALAGRQMRRYYCANSLFNGSKEVFILHGDQEYRLSVTRQDKLILTK